MACLSASVAEDEANELKSPEVEVGNDGGKNGGCRK